VLLILFVLSRRFVNSPFGATLKAIRDNRLRAMAIGIPVSSRLAVVYTVAAGVAGAAGVLLSQTTGFASLDLFEFHRSADVMLIAGDWRGWLAVWRGDGRDCVQADAGRHFQHHTAVLDVLDRAVSGGFGSGGARAPDSSLALVQKAEPREAAMSHHAGPDTVLAARGLVMKFGGITATNNVTLDLKKGARHALIGPNGAGKTTLINLLTGVLQPTSGRIVLEGQDITDLAPHQRVRRGMVRTFQINQLFDTLTPLETLAMTVSQQQGLGGKWWQALGSNRRVTERCEQLLEQFHLTTVMAQKTQLLAYGKRRLLEIAIALACEPRVLLLDEPVAGVPAGEREELLQTVAALPADVSVLLIEHDMDLVFSFAKRMTVLVNGTVLTEGEPDSIANDPQVKAVYLGHGDEINEAIDGALMGGIHHG
jgi:branched-chain amino acid transport system ATP-binding protein